MSTQIDLLMQTIDEIIQQLEVLETVFNELLQQQDEKTE